MKEAEKADSEAVRQKEPSLSGTGNQLLPCLTSPLQLDLFSSTHHEGENYAKQEVGMFEIFRKKKSAQATAIADIEFTLLKTFKRIQDASLDLDPLPRSVKIVSALAAMTGALRDVYPNFPIERENIAFALIEANASGMRADIDGLAGAVIRLVSRCPDLRKAKIETMIWMIAPKLMTR